MRYMCLLQVTLAVCVVSGCGRDEEPEFDGKTLSDWVSQATGGNQPMRLAAYDGLGSFPKDPTAARTLEEVLGNESTSTVERLAAGKNLFRVTGDADKVIAPVRAAIRKEAEGGSGITSAKQVDDLVFWLGARARPLVPDLLYARDKVRGQDVAAKQRRAAVQKTIDSIPNG